MLCTSGFMDDAMFLHNGANGAVSKTTLRLTEFARTGSEVAVHECLVSHAVNRHVRGQIFRTNSLPLQRHFIPIPN